MNFAEFQLLASGDPRLAAYAASPLPAWLWSSDGARILWANPAGAGVFGAADGAALANRIFGPADRHRRQVARLAGRMAASGAIGLERLQGFGAAAGMLATCFYQRIDFHDGSHGLLIATDAPPVVRERPVAAMQPETKAAEPPAVAAPVEPSPATPPAASAEQPSPQPIEAPAGFALFDAFDEPPTAPVAEPVIADEPEPNLESVLQLDLPHVEATPREPLHAEATPETAPAVELHTHEPSPYIEAVAGEPLPAPQRLPLRFMWQVDEEDRFTLKTDEFIRLIGPRTAAGFNRPWREIAAAFGLDLDGEVTKALATRATWSGIALDWPVDGGGRLAVDFRACRCSMPRGIFTATAASASAAISTASPGWRGARPSLARGHRPAAAMVGGYRPGRPCLGCTTERHPKRRFSRPCWRCVIFIRGIA